MCRIGVEFVTSLRKLKADRPHLRDYPHTPTNSRHTDKNLRLVIAETPVTAINFSMKLQTSMASTLKLIAVTGAETDGRTDGRTLPSTLH